MSHPFSLSPRQGSLLVGCLFGVALAAASARPGYPLETPGSSAENGLFRRENLLAWCIVPFDAKRRAPEERAAMLARLGFKHFAYDYRAEHVPTFDAEIEACRKHGIAFDAWWFPGSLNAEARHILEVCRKHDIHPQLWVSGGGAPAADPDEQRRRVEQEAARIRPIAEAAAAQGLKVGLYNHGGWFGEPENQLAVIEQLRLPNVGIVYNLHHGHDHVDRWAEILRKTMPHLLAVNLNGMTRAGDRRGQKILQLGRGELDLQLLRILRDSGYRGPIGILGHTQDDAEARLQDNLDGLDWLLPQLDGKPPGPQPKMRTPVPTPATADGAQRPNAAAGGFLAPGRAEYASLPLDVEIRATLRGKQTYNILVAGETKRSAAHWEVFTMPGTGHLTVYLPRRTPDHVRTTVDVCDGKPHDVVVRLAADRVRIFIDGRSAADAEIQTPPKSTVASPAPPEGLAVGRLVEGGIGCNGTVARVRLARALAEDAAAAMPAAAKSDAFAASQGPNVVGLWSIASWDASEIADRSSLKNGLKRAAVAPAGNAAPTPSREPHLQPTDPKLRVSLIDQSPDQVYLGVKVDRDGVVFVGGREGVFVFEPQADGTFAPRRELLRFPRDSIIMGLEFRGDDLLVLTANALYEVRDGRIRRENLTPRRVLWGLPLDLHVSFHCLAWGDDGRLYLTHGDPLLGYGDWQRPDHWGHWTLFSAPLSAKDAPPNSSEPAWRRTPFTGQGAVLRMDVDSGALEVVATGLRGPVGLTFDDRGNLFTNDNDHESRADQYAPARLLHVVEGVDFAWPRGWAASKSPDRRDLVEPMCDLGRGVPCDMAYGRGPLPAESLAGRILLCRWDRQAVTAYRPVPRGASFSAVEETVLSGDENCRPVGLALGPDGRLFVTNLYMTGNMAAPYCVSDLVVVAAADGARAAALREARPDRKSQAVAPAGPAQLRPASPSSQSLDDARSDDTYRRQLGTMQLARTATLEELRNLVAATDEATRLAGVLAVGRRLTVPAPTSIPAESVELFYPQESSFFKRMQSFYGGVGPVDLATFGRLGSYTTAQRWAKTERTPDEVALFELLTAALEDDSDVVRLQAAYWLSLLNDPRSEPHVVRTRRAIRLKRLKSAAESQVVQVWSVGPFAAGPSSDGADAAEPGPRPDPQRIDLSESFGGRTWERRTLGELDEVMRRRRRDADATYAYFRASSGARQEALVLVGASATPQLWINGASVAPLEGERFAGAEQAYLVDLQPGGNDVVVRYVTSSVGTFGAKGIGFRAASPLEIGLPEKLDSSLLAARLREAAASGTTTTLDPAFVAIDWTRAATEGDAVAGRRLFGSLACAKCHAVAPDQKSAGAPSLFEARRRFAVAHLVESVLLPSRQIAEPFRGQTITTAEGLTFTGLVTSESAETLELLLPDATRKLIAKRKIEERGPSTISPMPQGLVKTPGELRDLLAYLLSDRPLPP